MPAKSEVQQQAAGAALAAKRGEKSPSSLYGAAKSMYSGMSASQLGHFSSTKHKGLPHRKALSSLTTGPGGTNSVGAPAPKACMSMEDAGRAIVDEILAEEEIHEDDERAEVMSARNILAALSRLQASLTQATPEQQHDITTIRASANELVRMHGIV